jgi:SecD/SecF fusion protein
MGYAKIADTAYINTIFSNHQIKKLFPKEMKLLWSAKYSKYLNKSSQYEYFELFILYDKNADNEASMPVHFIKEATCTFSEIDHPEINFTMNEKGAKEWKSLTGNNIGRAIAIVLDNKVFAAPKVMTQIEGGRSQITGDFTIEEATDLANVLKAGRYNFNKSGTN